ncbi:DUF7139 domain-containing protein [Haloglomus litoreum]|uniref:DUF7139 domain-containing protein n=1 Tax=Haloglomus litoreum TaxID=3034026 RepID=UPI0023E7F2CB|nr:hypothetical protein [Haloglomus sp. DT116]
MASLTDVYEGGAGGPDLRRLYLGVGLFLVGAVLTVGGIVIGTSTGVAAWLGLDTFGAREVAGVAAGVGLPVTFLGVVVVLPQTTRRVNAAAVLGSAIALFGVVLFTRVYPQAWFDNAFPVVAVYFVGMMTTLWALFSAVASFKTRNDPGGTVELRITEGGETRVVEVSNQGLASKLGGIGLMGGTPDGNVQTQTAGSSSGTTATATAEGGAEVMSASNEPETDSLTERARSSSGRNQRHAGATTNGGERGARAASGVSDGGTTTDDAEVFSGGVDADPHPNQDLYCGNCSHFRYVRTDQGMQPYCGLHSEVMDDMDACEEWTPNNR